MSDNGLKSGSNLEKILTAGHFAFTGECGPPKGANVAHLKEKMEPLRGMVDAINVTDKMGGFDDSLLSKSIPSVPPSTTTTRPPMDSTHR